MALNPFAPSREPRSPLGFSKSPLLAGIFLQQKLRAVVVGWRIYRGYRLARRSARATARP